MRSEAKRGEFLKRQNFFNKIVGIRLDPAVIAAQAAEMGVTLAGPSFCAVVFDCQDREEAVRNLGLKGDDQLAFMLYNVAEEVAGRHGQQHAFADYYGRTIVLLEGEAEPLRQDARTLAAEVVGFFKKSFALKILARTGSAAPGLEHIHASFEQADSLYLVDCADELLDYADWQKRRSGVVFPGAVYAEQLFDALSSEEGAEGLPRVARLHKVAGCMFRREVVESMDLDALRQNVAVVANLLMAKFAAVDVTIPPFSPRGENAEACSRVFLDWLQEVEAALGEQTSGKRRAMARIFACIEKNYQDVEFSGETVCREMGMSTSSFSTLFKSVTGTTFTKYLNTYRIERAKEMLRCTDRPVGEVGEKVGYLSNAYFGLVFKNATGLTPNAYRRQYGGER